jgi:arylsulfatase A-like enzyme
MSLFAALAFAVVAQAAPPAPPAAAPPPASAPLPATQSGAAKEVKRRNVAFYLIDTCRADQLSAYGCPRKTSPFLEKLAAMGARFDHCFAQAPWTLPSMSAILTSCYPSVTGMHRFFDQLDPAFVTLPEALQQAGWHTAGFSANPLMGKMSNYQQGFDEFTEAADVIPGGDAIGHSTGSARALNQKVLPWLQQNQKWPCFLYVHSIDPHEQYAPEPEFLRRFTTPDREREYRKQLVEIRQKNPGKIGSVTTQEHFDRAHVKVGPFIETALALYDGDICANDDEIGPLFDTLRRTKPLEEWILVVTADHGEEFFEHGGTSHAYTLWNELLHVPLIVVAPGLVPAGLVVKEPVQSLDLYPTLLELLGVAPPPDLQGTSFAASCRGDEKAAGHPVFAENHSMPGSERFLPEQGNMLTVIEGPWKYILNVKSSFNRPRPRHELYRLDRDFAEKNNLAESEPERVARFETMVLEWWARNRARHSGVDVKHLTEAQIAEADPATLERLRKLGYVK